jgi:predicted nucleic acid-binding protein
MFMSAALIAGCTTLWSENFHNTLLIEGRLSVINQLS